MTRETWWAQTRFAEIDSDLAILKWMVAGLYGVLTIGGGRHPILGR